MTIQKHNFRGIVPSMGVRADAGSAETMKLINEIKSTFEQFKAANDEQIKAKFKDVVKAEQVERINADITKLTASLNDLLMKQAAAEVNGSMVQPEMVKNVAAFAKAVNKPDITTDDYTNYVKAIDTYCRRGGSTPREALAMLEVGSEPAGGYTVQPDLSGRMVKKIFETSPFRQHASIVTLGNSDTLQGFVDRDEAGAGWVGETAARTETDTPDIGMWQIPVHEIYAMPIATQKILDDSGFDLESWLMNKVSEKIARTENTAFASGNGILKPRGLLSYGTAETADGSRAWGQFEHIKSGSTSGVSNTDFLISVIFSLKTAYRTNAKWFMNRNTVGAMRKLKDGDGNYLWQPNFELRQGGTFLGYPVVEFEDFPDIAPAALSLGFGDMRETYTIVERSGMRLIRDNVTTKGQVKFYVYKRLGGDVLNFDSFKFMKFSV